MAYGMTDAGSPTLRTLLADIRACRLCANSLPESPRPVVQADRTATILIAGQAPGRRVHETGIPFDDPSGDRLRDWMGVDRDTFYDPGKMAIAPMGFCYPGTGKSGDLPPRTECAATWRAKLLKQLPNIRLTLIIGAYAVKWHLPNEARQSLTDCVKGWQTRPDTTLVLPHPSPRNNIWLKKNPWFARELLPVLRTSVGRALE